MTTPIRHPRKSLVFRPDADAAWPIFVVTKRLGEVHGYAVTEYHVRAPDADAADQFINRMLGRTISVKEAPRD